MVNIDRAAPKVTVGTALGKTQQYTGTGDLDLLHLPSGFPIKRHLMPGFHHTLVGVGPLYDADFTVTFTREAVIIRDKQGTPVLTGWRETTGSRLWRISLQLGELNLPSMTNDENLSTLVAYRAYELPLGSFERYFP